MDYNINDVKKTAEGLLPGVGFIVLVPVFFIIFSLVYNPFDIMGYYDFDRFGYGFHILMVTCIILVTLIISRIIMHAADKRYNLILRDYIIWCICEVFAACCFTALYTGLFKQDSLNYFQTLGICFKHLYLSLIFPYTILIILQQMTAKAKAEATKKAEPGDNMARFYDEHGKLKFTIVASNIVFINSEANYVKIHYMEGGNIHEFLLRNSMKSLENYAGEIGLVRCQRSFFVNPSHIKVLRKTTGGIMNVEFNIEGINPIPVSKTYYDELAQTL